MRYFAAYVEWDPKSQLYVGTVPGIPGARAQAANLDELKESLREALELCLRNYEGEIADLPTFIGIQQIEVAE